MVFFFMPFSPVELNLKWQKYTVESFPFVLRMQEKAMIEWGYLIVIVGFRYWQSDLQLIHKEITQTDYIQIIKFPF